MRALLLTAFTLPLLSLAETVTLYAWPLSSASPSPLATIQYTPSSPSSPSPSTSTDISAKVDSWTPPAPPAANDELIRIGLYDPKTKSWTGVVTGAASFAPGLAKKVTLRVDAEGRVWGVGFAAGAAPGLKKGNNAKGKSGENLKEKEEGEVRVEVVGVQKGPEPVLNKPVVLSPEGRVQEKEGEKTFLQKYWWAIAIFLLVQVVAGGGGDK